MPGILSYLGLGESNPIANKNAPVRALPASWYTSQEMYDLEKRAIFSKKWLLLTSKVRLPQAGDWLKFEVAGYEIILSRGRKDNQIHGFHNVCRHRAYPLVEGDSGTAKLFSCRYHGWSYGLDGKLAKAPKYDELEDFDKSQNNLFSIHVKVDIKGFVWVNLDSSSDPEPWDVDFAGIDIQTRYSQFGFDDYVFNHEYCLTGSYNWKILADNFNECYHCPTTHPTIPQLADITTHDVDTDRGFIIHQSVPTEQQKKDGCAISSTYYFPNVSLSVLPHFMMLQRFLPSGPNTSTMHYQIFRNKNSSEAEFKLISDLYAQVVSEDKTLCEAVQKNLRRGLFRNGELHPRLEKGPLYFQERDRKAIREHVGLERAAKRQIWPAGRDVSSSDVVSREDEELCSGLACHTGQAVLNW